MSNVETGGAWGVNAPPPEYLAAQLTIFQPGKDRLSPPITTSGITEYYKYYSLFLSAHVFGVAKKTIISTYPDFLVKEMIHLKILNLLRK